MKLIAIAWIADQTPEGTVFDIPDDDLASAHALILAGLAKEQSEDPPTPRRGTYRRRDLRAEDGS